MAMGNAEEKLMQQMMDLKFTSKSLQRQARKPKRRSRKVTWTAPKSTPRTPSANTTSKWITSAWPPPP
ncbi:hypothetical protein ACS0TY_030502 [Phlomoides rotata]